MDAACLLLRVTTAVLVLGERMHAGDVAAAAELEAVGALLALASCGGDTTRARVVTPPSERSRK